MKLVDNRDVAPRKKTFADLETGAVFAWKGKHNDVVLMKMGVDSVVVLFVDCAFCPKVCYIDQREATLEVQEFDTTLTISRKLF